MNSTLFRARWRTVAAKPWVQGAARFALRRRDSEDELGHYEIISDDGTISRADIRYGENIARPDLRYDEDVAAVPYWADVAWEGYDHKGKPVTLYSYEWTNPRPEKAIREVRSVYPDDSHKGQVLLFAVTGVSLS